LPSTFITMLLRIILWILFDVRAQFYIDRLIYSTNYIYETTFKGYIIFYPKYVFERNVQIRCEAQYLKW
jgi:hypothetical protein